MSIMSARWQLFASDDNKCSPGIIRHIYSLGNINTVPGNVMSIAMSIPLPSIYVHIYQVVMSIQAN